MGATEAKGLLHSAGMASTGCSEPWRRWSAAQDYWLWNWAAERGTGGRLNHVHKRMLSVIFVWICIYPTIVSNTIIGVSYSVLHAGDENRKTPDFNLRVFKLYQRFEWGNGSTLLFSTRRGWTRKPKAEKPKNDVIILYFMWSYFIHHVITWWSSLPERQ